MFMFSVSDFTFATQLPSNPTSLWGAMTTEADGLAPTTLTGSAASIHIRQIAIFFIVFNIIGS